MQSHGPSNPVHIEPRIVKPLEFVGLTVSSLDEVEDINNLFNEKISMLGQESYFFLRQDFDDAESYIRTETATQYLDAIKDGAVPFSNYDMGMQAFFVEIADTLLFLMEAKPSKFSLISDDLMDLPVSILPWAGSEERIRHQTDGEK